MKICGFNIGMWGKLHWKNHSLANELCTFCCASFSRFWVAFLRREEKERERELESGKRHWQRVRLNYEKRLCILSPALPQTFASIMHTPTQSACGTQLQCTQREREGYIERERGRAERLQQGLLLFARRAQFTAWQIRRISCGFEAFRLVGCLVAWLGSLATLIAS